jgi:hypothetical protein
MVNQCIKVCLSSYSPLYKLCERWLLAPWDGSSALSQLGGVIWTSPQTLLCTIRHWWVDQWALLWAHHGKCGCSRYVFFRVHWLWPVLPHALLVDKWILYDHRHSHVVWRLVLDKLAKLMTNLWCLLIESLLSSGPFDCPYNEDNWHIMMATQELIQTRIICCVAWWSTAIDVLLMCFLLP